MIKKVRGTGGVDNTSYGASIPEDIIFDILTKLPVKSLLRFRCVCKSWSNLFKSPNFAKFQLDYSLENRSDGILIESESGKNIWYLDSDSLLSDSSTLYKKLVHIAYPLEYKKKEFIGSSHGLVCYISSKEDIVILNPFTREYKKIPTAPQRYSGSCGYGFGYDLKTETYKLIVYILGDPWTKFYVYSLKLNSWERIRNIEHGVPVTKIMFCNGYFYWLEVFLGDRKEMGCFDIANETMKHILLPKHFPYEQLRARQVCILGGCLCLYAIDRKKNNSEIWTMKDYGVADSWIKMFTIDNGRLLELRHSDLGQTLKNDAILVHHGEYRSTYLYDLKHEVRRELEIDGIMPGSHTRAFFGSLVSPNRNTCLDMLKNN